MPPKSEKQRRFMEMMANKKKKRGSADPSPEVAKKFLSHKSKGK